MTKEYLEELERLTEYFEPYEDEDNTNPSEALKCLEEIHFFVNGSRIDGEKYEQKLLELKTIKQALIKSENCLGARRNGKALEQMYQLVKYSKAPMKPSIWVANIDGEMEQRVIMEKEYYDTKSKKEQAWEIVVKKGLPLPEKDIIRQSKDYNEYCIKWSWLGKTTNIATQKTEEEFNVIKEVVE